MKKVAIIICSYNQDKLLIECLNSLKKTKYKEYKIFLVDDSGERLIANKLYFNKNYSHINFIINKDNLGFSKSNNIGIKKAIDTYNPDYFLLLNDDTEITNGNWLSKMIEVGESDKDIGVLGCKLIYPDGRLQHAGGNMEGWKIGRITEIKKEIFEVDHIMGAFMLIKKEVINKIGLLDEIFSPFLLEDTDYCLRAKKSGFKVMSVTSVEVIHKKGKSIDSMGVGK